MAKVRSDGTSLVYCGYIGGSGNDWGYVIAVDAAGNAYVTGWTDSAEATFPVAGGPDLTFNGGDAFVAKVSGEGGPTPQVKVVSEYSGPVADAAIYRNGAWVGATGTDGLLSIPDLRAGDKLAATSRITETVTSRGSHSQDSTQNWAYRVYLTSVAIDNQGNPALHTVANTSTTQVLTVTQRNTLIGFNIVASVEWDASAGYLEELRQGFENASAYLYDVSDGQMYLERVTLYDNGQNWADADYQVYASNQEWPHTNDIGGPQSSADLHVFLGRYFDGNSNQGLWTQPSGYRTQVHEFGHYGLGLYDSYYYYWGPFKLDGECTSAAVRTNSTPDINATMMYYPYNATELSMQGVNGLWSTQCQQTHQWQVNVESDWETLVRNYRDIHFPPRWEIRTPSGRGGVVAGPWSIPVAGWMNATIGDNANTGTCSVEPVYRARYWGMMPAPWVDVWLEKANRIIYQGKTDLQGEITVLGAANGDRLIAVQWVADLDISSTQVSCLTGLAMGSSTEIVLQPAPFVLDIAVVPTGAAGQAQVSIRASTALSGMPQVQIFQSGSTAPTSVPVAYDSVTQAYTGTFGLDPALPQAGDVEVIAEDTSGHNLQLFHAFSLAQVPASQDVTIYSADGQVELYLPAGSLSADGRLSIAPQHAVGALPEGLVMVSGPYTIQAGSGITLTEAVALTLRYLDTGGSLSQANLSTVQVYRRGAAGQWVPLSSNVLEDHNAVSAAIDSLGTYAALAERQYLLYIPIAMRNH